MIGLEGGFVVTSVDDVPKGLAYAAKFDEGLFLAPSDYSKLDFLAYLNHSCDSNVARIGGLLYIAKKDIPAGGELTIDYAPLVTDVENWKLECLCGVKSCRKTITSDDWKNSAIAKKLWNEWLPYVQKKILGAS